MSGDAPPTTEARSEIRAGLLAWYDAGGRRLPWRARRGELADPYRVWLSEIMLQQTTVAHATPYFLAFLARWPTVEALAGAADGEVMAAWAGLGYYARARRLLECARVVAGEHGGRFPAGEAALRALPGIGPYTAAAVAAIAFDAPASVVDGNVERVIARLFAVETPLPAAKPELTRLAATLAVGERPGDWAQAMMDLGAMVCRPAAPLCDRCPIARFCRARAGGAPGTYPRRSPRPDRPHRHGAAFRLRHGERVALVRRPPRGLLGGMLALPTTDWRSERWTARQIEGEAPAGTGWRPIGAVAHAFTHFSLDLAVWEGRADIADPAYEWLTADEAARVAPSVFAKAIRL